MVGALAKYENIRKLEHDLRTKSPEYWVLRGKNRTLQLFREVTKRVPAYRIFLKKNGVNPATIKTFRDFTNHVPLTSKDSYLRHYPLEEMTLGSKFKNKHWDIASTSGSTGEPFYFPRTDVQNLQYAASAELYMRTNFQIHKRSTLYINCFALGVWIGGIFTYEAVKTVARRGYPITLINPGINKIEILKTVKNLGHKFDQIIIGGYPPFVKDVIDDGTHSGIHWKRYKIGIIFSAEGFSEHFRDYVAKHAGLKNIYTNTLNHYGTVDQGTLAHETPVSILIRRLALQKPKLHKLVFPDGPHRLPTLCQYDPELFFFEEVNGAVVCSSNAGLPLIRYDLKDNGGVLSYEQMQKIFIQAGLDLEGEVAKADIAQTLWRLPFVYVYERKDMSVSFSGANVYPETIRKAFLNKALHKIVTGKFRMEIEHDSHENPRLRINAELRSGIKRPSKKNTLLATTLILKSLLKENSEFKSAFYDQHAGRAIPRLVFYPYEHGEYFRVGGKQKWSVK